MLWTRKYINFVGIQKFMFWEGPKNEDGLKLTLFKEEQPPYRSKAESHVGAAVLAHVARSGWLDAALRWTEPHVCYPTAL